MNEEQQDQNPQFPSYPTPQPQGLPIADSKQSAVLGKRISKMMTPKMKPRMKGIQSDQNVHFKHGKTKKHPNPVTYY